MKSSGSSAPLRIAQTVHGLGVGGAQRVIEMISRDLVPRGHEVFVYTPHAGVMESALNAAGARIRIQPRKLPMLDPGWILRLHRAFRADRIDLVHLHLFGDTLHGLPAARALGVPVVVTLHNELQRHSLLQRSLYPQLLGQAASLVACSETVAESLRPWPRLSTQVQVVRNGIHPAPPSPNARQQLRTSAGLEENDRLILFAGRLTAQKNPLLLVEAASQLGGSVHLWLAGEGEDERDVRASAAAKRMGTRLRLLGSRSDIPDLLEAADIVALPSRYEGLPMTLLEAMAAGCAIVAADVGGIPEATGSRGALLFSADNRGQCADALAALATDSPRRSRLGAAARARFEEEFTGSAMSARYHSIYETLTSRKVAA